MTSRASACSTLLALSVLGAACGSRTEATADAARATTSTSAVQYAYDRIPLDTMRPAGAIIDSVFPMPEMLRRFRNGLPAISTLQHGAASRDALVRSFVDALASSDRTTLGHMTLSRAEFAYVYFPNLADISSDAVLSPQRHWDQLTLNSEKGIGRALTRLGGTNLTLQAVACPASPIVRGALKLQERCTVRIGKADTTVFSGRLFGTIVEQAGRFKFVGYPNDM